MEKIIEQIKKFHDVFGIKESDTFGVSDSDRDALHYELLIEEVNEFKEACDAGNKEKIIDGIGDILFVAISAAVERGYTPILEPVMLEICRANISKKGDSPDENEFREDGKVMRSKNYQPPQIAEIINNHTNK